MAILSLFGSGEFLPWAASVDRWCVEQAAGSGKVLVCPTASAPEGDETFSKWATMGVDHYRTLGLSPEVLEVRTREDAERRAIASALDGASLIFFSGGNPGYLAETLSGTALWEAILRALDDGVALGGCSAGAAAFGMKTFWVQDDRVDRWVPGLDLLPKAFILPHFDQLDHYQPGLRRKLMKERPAGSVLIGIDEDTALYGKDDSWRVTGKAAAWFGEAGTRGDDLTAYRDGDSPLAVLGLGLG